MQLHEQIARPKTNGLLFKANHIHQPLDQHRARISMPCQHIGCIHACRLALHEPQKQRASCIIAVKSFQQHHDIRPDVRLHTVQTHHQRRAEFICAFGRHHFKQNITHLCIGHAIDQQHHTLHVCKGFAYIACKSLFTGNALRRKCMRRLHAQTCRSALALTQKMMQRLYRGNILHLAKQCDHIPAHRLLPQTGF